MKSKISFFVRVDTELELPKGVVAEELWLKIPWVNVQGRLLGESIPENILTIPLNTMNYETEDVIDFGTEEEIQIMKENLKKAEELVERIFEKGSIETGNMFENE